MIRVENLSYEYPGTRALDDVSFHIDKGGITVFVGLNGAGKSMLLQCMAALQEPFSGRTLINDSDIHKTPRQVHRMIGYLPDFFGLYEKLLY